MVANPASNSGKYNSLSANPSGKLAGEFGSVCPSRISPFNSISRRLCFVLRPIVIEPTFPRNRDKFPAIHGKIKIRRCFPRNGKQLRALMSAKFQFHDSRKTHPAVPWSYVCGIESDGYKSCYHTFSRSTAWIY